MTSPKYSLKNFFLSEHVEEAALNVSSMDKEGLALLVVKDHLDEYSRGKFAILYDWKQALADLGDEIEAAAKRKRQPMGNSPSMSWTPADPTPYNVKDLITKNIKAYIYLADIVAGSDCDKDALNVKLSASEKGYGPFMYDVALAMAYPKYLTPDRGSVSTEAFRVWKYYLTKRPDVESAPISKSCGTPGTNTSGKFNFTPEELEIVNRKYRMPEPKNSPALARLIRNSDNFFAEVKKLETAEPSIQNMDPDAFISPAKRFFAKKFK